MLPVASALLAGLLLGSSIPANALPEGDVRRIFSWLTADIGEKGASGVSYSSRSGLQLPLSFWSTPEYFGEYICKMPQTNCSVLDVYNPNTYELFPRPGQGGDLQIERVMTVSGVNIYDAACYQIAMALGSRDNPQLASRSTAIDKWLSNGHSADERNPAPNSNRAITRWDGLFTYGDTRITDPEKAYVFRYWPRQWLQFDPLINTKYESYIEADLRGASDPVYQRGKITWADYKPITGENSWGLLLGPIQALYVREIKYGQKRCVDFQNDAVRNAVGVLDALLAMQSPYGAVYYAVKGSLGNTGDAPVNPYAVSVENNASLYAGLVALQKLLKMLKDNSCPADAGQLNAALAKLETLVTNLQKFFATYAWDQSANVLITGGFANPDKWVPYSPDDPTNPQAVDVVTWGISALTPKFFEESVARSRGSAFKSWKKIKDIAGYYNKASNAFMGVGYSSKDQRSILSAEWTFGAINMLRSVVKYYKEIGATEYIAEIQADIESMLSGTEELRSDRYGGSQAFVDKPPKWNELLPMPSNHLAYNYASKRYFIPFGWYANPLPSTTSTSWALMLHYEFNPFTLGGAY